MVIQATKVGGVANHESYLYVKTPSSHGTYVVDSRGPKIEKTVSYIAASGWWWDRFKGSGVV